MKESLLLAGIILLSFHTFGQSVTTWQTSKLPPSPRYDDVFFINNKGWTAGGGSGLIHRTTNGGIIWNEVLATDEYLRSIQFLDDSTGFCGGLGGGVYRTLDGGTTWTDISGNIQPEIPGICGMARADDSTIYGVGVWFEPAYVVKSTDKGDTWTYIDMSEYATSLIDAFFFDRDHGFVTGSVSEEGGGIVLYTADGGSTWTEKFRTNHTGDRIWKIQTPDTVHFFGSVETWMGDTRIIRSSDSGQSWESLQVDPAYYYCQMVGFIDSLQGYTGGNQTLFETLDGGESWQKITVGAAYNRFFKINETSAYLTGQSVYKLTRKTLPPPIITNTLDQDPYDPVHRMTISPNPASATAMVTVVFGTRTPAHIYLYSASGKLHKKIFDGVAERGEQKFIVDITDLSPEEYIVILKTNEGMVNAKLLRL